ncbi:MAG: ATP-binding protein [Candidatus Methanoplasma sp.]|nr:ATP-binding protein [Candidatus Methanoplasma sp.]
MRRLAYDDLVRWKDGPRRKPLILSGVRQCGKTYLLKEFGKKNYENTAYINFEDTPGFASVFDMDLDPRRIVGEISLFTNKPVHPEKTLIIFDEVQFCGRAITSLKYFCENAPEYHVACAGSLLGVRLSRSGSFPVGKVDFIDLLPMGFLEFLMANGEEMLCNHLRESYKGRLSTPLTAKLETCLRHYYVVGGMPEAVSEWVSSKDVVAVEDVQKKILRSYAEDFGRHAAEDLNELTLIWRSIPVQLSRENKRFIFSHVKTGKRARDLEHALEWLVSAGLVHKVRKISRPTIPLSAYSDETIFKVYFVDVGLLRVLAGVPPAFIFDAGGEYSHFKGAVTENYALNELKILGKDPYYWRSKGDAEVDFVDVFGSLVVPIEVKLELNRKSKSLAQYVKEYDPKNAVVISMNNAGNGNGVAGVPLWAVWMIKDIVGDYTLRSDALASDDR